MSLQITCVYVNLSMYCHYLVKYQEFLLEKNAKNYSLDALNLLHYTGCALLLAALEKEETIMYISPTHLVKSKIVFKTDSTRQINCRFHLEEIYQFVSVIY